MYALVDCNNFYCSCERLFEPSLNKRPIIVLSNNDGCVIARSEEAKLLGIAMGSPEYMMRPLIRKHQVAVFSSNYTLYGDMSDRVMKTLSGFVPQMELYSIDEAFLDMSTLRYANLLKLGCQIRETVQQNTGIPVTVGIAQTRTLAKLANRYAKKYHKDLGVYWLANDVLIAQALAATLVSDIWGVGPNYAKMLEINGFRTAADLAGAPEEWVRTKMSVVGLRLLKELNGIPCQAWELEPAKKKNIATTRSFGTVTQDETLLMEALSNHTATAAAKLRRQGSCARQLQVFVQTNVFRNQDAQYSHQVTMELAVPSSDTSELIKYALKGLGLIFRPGYNYNKCGVVMLDLITADKHQTGLFDTADRPRRRRLVEALDKVNQAFGKDAVRYAVQGFERRYKLKADHLSQRYTTNINEVLHVKI